MVLGINRLENPSCTKALFIFARTSMKLQPIMSISNHSIMIFHFSSDGASKGCHVDRIKRIVLGYVISDESGMFVGWMWDILRRSSLCNERPVDTQRTPAGEECGESSGSLQHQSVSWQCLKSVGGTKESVDESIGIIN